MCSARILCRPILGGMHHQYARISFTTGTTTGFLVCSTKALLYARPAIEKFDVPFGCARCSKLRHLIQSTKTSCARKPLRYAENSSNINCQSASKFCSPNYIRGRRTLSAASAECNVIQPKLDLFVGPTGDDEAPGGRHISAGTNDDMLARA
jgi:hypothetical protein